MKRVIIISTNRWIFKSYNLVHNGLLRLNFGSIMYIKDEIVISSYWINTTHQRKVILMNNITGDLYRIEGIITSIFFDPWSNVFYLYINLLETQLRTSLGIIGDLLYNHNFY